MFLLVLMLDNPDLLDRVMQAWFDLGIRGIYMIEGAGCREPEECARERGPTGLLSFASLLGGGHLCHGLLLAAVDSLAVAQQAAAAVEPISGPWAKPRTAMMFALPVAAFWGVAGPAVGSGGPAGAVGSPEQEAGRRRDAI